MVDRRFDELEAEALAGRLTRRQVLRRGAALGLTAPAIAALLAACGGSSSTPTATTAASTTTTGASTTTTTTTTGGTGAATPSTAGAATAAATTAPTGKAGGAGQLKLLWWQAPTILNAHLSSGTKDFDASRVVLEPLADFDINSKMVAVLAAEPLPTLDNGMVSKDGMSVTWKLKPNVTWQDGQPFTANDVKFTFTYLSDKGTAATTYGIYEPVQSVDVVDDHTVKVNFKEATAGWFLIFTGANGMVLPEHLLKDYVGAKARQAPFNLKPVGTGPYKVDSFAPGDNVQYSINTSYWDPGKPHFDTISMKGGGDATSAARAVLQAGEVDYAWNIQVEPSVLQSMTSGGAKGKVQTWGGGGTERLEINHADPQTVTNGEKSYYTVPHPHFKVKEVRQALALSIQRDVIANTLYGPGGKATASPLNNDPQYNPPDATWKYDLTQAKQLLDQAGAKPGGDGILVLNGRPMNWVWATSVNSVRQKNQEIVKAALQQIGIAIQIKATDASVFFSGDPGNPDTLNRAEFDLGMWTNGANLYPILWMKRYLSANPATDIAQKSNQFSATNVIRYQNDQWNQLYAQVSKEIDPAKYTPLFQQMMKLVIDDVAEIGQVARNNVACVASTVKGNNPTSWASDLWDLKNWTRSS